MIGLLGFSHCSTRAGLAVHSAIAREAEAAALVAVAGAVLVAGGGVEPARLVEPRAAPERVADGVAGLRDGRQGLVAAGRARAPLPDVAGEVEAAVRRGAEREAAGRRAAVVAVEARPAD